MNHKIRREIVKQDQIRALLPENAYVRALKKKNGALIIDNVTVDAPELIERRFLCDTLHCMRLKKSGRYKGSCCTDLEVDLTPREIKDLRRLAKRYLKSSMADPKRPEHTIARRLVESDDWMEENYRDEACLVHSKEKVCALGYIARDGRLLCGLNAMAAALDEPLEKWKLPTCFVFPLHYVEFKTGHYLLTVITKENHWYLDAADEIGALRCLKKPQADAPPAYVSLRAEIELLLGKPFYKKLATAAVAYLDKNENSHD